jgi:hypothetical protein
MKAVSLSYFVRYGRAENPHLEIAIRSEARAAVYHQAAMSEEVFSQ